jgi:hypothetical protein
VSASLPPTDADFASTDQKPAEQRTLEAILLYGLAVFGGLIAILSAALAQVSPTEILMVTLAVTTALVALVPMVFNHSLPHARRHVLLMVFSISFACFYAFPLLTQYFLGDPLAEGHMRLVNIAPRDILAAQQVILLALVCIFAGYVYPIGRFIGNLLPTPTAEWQHGTALFVAIVMIFLGWTVGLGGISGLIPRRLGSGVLGAISASMWFGISLLTIINLRYRSQPARLLMWVLVPVTMVFGFMTGSKSFALSPLVAIVISHIVIERRIRAAWVLGGAFALIALYPIAQFWREVS